MSAGRPNNYVQIIRELGGSATAAQIFTHGCKERLISGTFESCKVSLRGNVKKGNLIGKVSGILMVAPEKIREIRRKEAPQGRLKEVEARLNALEERLAKIESVAFKQHNVA